jgi:hypothetical protein
VRREGGALSGAQSSIRGQAKIMPEVKLGQFHPDAMQGADATGGHFLKMKGVLSR